LITQISIIFFRKQITIIAFLSLLLASCATLSSADRISQPRGFKKAELRTKYFTLLAYYRITKPVDPLNIYIEGDGNAWSNRTHLSNDPTPRNPLALELAVIDPSPNVAYLARPGQYLKPQTAGVKSAYWSDKRFSKEVITSMNEAVSQLAQLAKTDKINLIGYSGGAAVAVLIAAQRNDIISLRTIAGNLDSEAVNKYHKVSPLSGSFNPINFAQKVKNLPQRHFAGSKDTVIPLFVAESFIRRVGDKDYSRITVVEGATHSKGWRSCWKELLTYPVRQSN